MASPQLEDGYTPIANEILEQLAKVNLSSYESRVLWYIIRNTYGWHKKSDLISLDQIARGTNIKKPHASRALKNLERRNIITRIGKKQIGFQKDYSKWLQKLPKEVTTQKLPKQVTPVTSTGNKKLPIQEPTKNIRKKLHTKDRKDKSDALLQRRSAGLLDKIIKEFSLDIAETDKGKIRANFRNFMKQHPEVTNEEIIEWFKWERQHSTIDATTLLLMISRKFPDWKRRAEIVGQRQAKRRSYRAEPHPPEDYKGEW